MNIERLKKTEQYDTGILQDIVDTCSRVERKIIDCHIHSVLKYLSEIPKPNLRFDFGNYKKKKCSLPTILKSENLDYILLHIIYLF